MRGVSRSGWTERNGERNQLGNPKVKKAQSPGGGATRMSGQMEKREETGKRTGTMYCFYSLERILEENGRAFEASV